MYGDMAPSLVSRLQATSYALSLGESLQEIADEVYDLDHAGVSERDINRRIRAWMSEQDLGYESWRAEVEEGFRGVPFLEALDLHKVWLAYGVEPWLQECIRSVAFTGDPIVFLPFAAGFWVEDDTQDPPVLVAVMTPLTDPQLAARQLVEKHRKMFGTRASGSARKDEVFNARMLARRRAGMNDEEIAIQNLREKHPDIVRHPYRHRDELKREKDRVRKAIPAAERLWKERGLEVSEAG